MLDMSLEEELNLLLSSCKSQGDDQRSFEVVVGAMGIDP